MVIVQQLWRSISRIDGIIGTKNSSLHQLNISGTMARYSKKCSIVRTIQVSYPIFKLLIRQAAAFLIRRCCCWVQEHVQIQRRQLRTPTVSVAGAEQSTSGRQTRCACHWNTVEGHTYHLSISAETVKTDPTCLSPDIHVTCWNEVWCTDLTCTPFMIDMRPLIMGRSWRKELQLLHQWRSWRCR